MVAAAMVPAMVLAAFRRHSNCPRYTSTGRRLSIHILQRPLHWSTTPYSRTSHSRSPCYSRSL
eukprot:2928473-Prymnesium_polylepis.1